MEKIPTGTTILTWGDDDFADDDEYSVVGCAKVFSRIWAIIQRILCLDSSIFAIPESVTSARFFVVTDATHRLHLSDLGTSFGRRVEADFLYQQEAFKT